MPLVSAFLVSMYSKNYIKIWTWCHALSFMVSLFWNSVGKIWKTKIVLLSRNENNASRDCFPWWFFCQEV
jgi:hypothetical protein